MLTVHRGSRGDVLLEGLGQMLGQWPDDPFAPEVIAVPTRGVERWITQRLSEVVGTSPGRRDGVCANIDFPFPGRLLDRCAASATGIDPTADPWAPERSAWGLLEVVTGALDEPQLATLAAHLGVEGAASRGSNPRWSRRFATVRHLADLFDRYAMHRPAMLQAWAEGDDSDGSGEALGPDLVWQAWLWRRLAEHLVVPGPAQRLPQVCQRLREDPEVVSDLPPRLSVFGLTRLPPAHLQLLMALSTHRHVHLWLLHPSPTLWSALAPAAPLPGSSLRRSSEQALGARHRLLRTWGRDSRELQALLEAAGSVDPGSTGDDPLPDPPAPDSLLGRIQADVRADRRPPGGPGDGGHDLRLAVDARDNSLQVHSCHGRARQVEVLRDAIAHLLCNDPTLEPRDVVVMCPDIDAFAPLIQATFGSAAQITHRDLHVRLADRSIRQTNPLFTTMTQLLELASGRMRASEVLDLASTQPVRRRFRFDDDDLSRISEWSRDAGVRWGLDPQSRAPFKMTGIPEGTWHSGLDRLLLGVAMSEDGLRCFGDVLPLDDVDSGDVELAGRFAEFIDRLAAVVSDLRTPGSLEQWLTTLAAATDTLTATSPSEDWQRVQFDQTVDDVRQEAGSARCELTLPEVQSLFADRLRGRPTRANFRTGHLTMCTLVPMRSVPHRVVCLLGLDDGVFPRHSEPDGDDIIARKPFVGDPDPRSEDRQLLLDALLAAQDHLVITYTGRDERTNAPRPPAVPLGELLETVERTARPPSGRRSVLDQVVLHHPLQPFAAPNFIGGQLTPDHPWSFDSASLAGAQAAAQRDGRGPAATTRPRAPGPPLPPAPRDPIELADLLRFVQHPVRAFLRQRLGVTLYGDEREPSDALPLDLDGLQRWAIGDRLLRSRLEGIDATTAWAAERGRGELPPGALGNEILSDLLPEVEQLVTAAQATGPAQSTSLDLSAPLIDGRRVVGTVGGLSNDLIQTVTWSRLGPKHRLAAWVRLLALTATDPQRPWHARSIGRMAAGGGGRASVVSIGPMAPDATTRLAIAQAVLSDLVDLFDRGLCEPLPLPCATAAAWAEAIHKGRDPVLAARAKWETTQRDFPGEDLDVEHQFVHGGTCIWEDLAAMAPGSSETGPGWADDETTRLGRLSRRLWDVLLANERRR